MRAKQGVGPEKSAAAKLEGVATEARMPGQQPQAEVVKTSGKREAEAAPAQHKSGAESLAVKAKAAETPNERTSSSRAKVGEPHQKVQGGIPMVKSTIPPAVKSTAAPPKPSGKRDAGTVRNYVQELADKSSQKKIRGEDPTVLFFHS